MEIPTGWGIKMKNFSVGGKTFCGATQYKSDDRNVPSKI